ncbi:alanine racemase [Bacillus massilioanorexius]|uniref:alanine racemase n=1 Tax=Bacillus TaxID=1386 RepID=UPI00037A9671
MNSAFYRDTWAEINLDYIYDNVSKMKSMLNEDVKLCAVVKANGYGHGDLEVAQTAIEAGADFLAVAFLDEAIILRKKGIVCPILVLGAVRASDVEMAARLHVSITVFNNDWLNEASTHIPQGLKLPIHIKCDTGMGRLGYRDASQLKAAEEIIRQTDVFMFEGIYTHFATADELDLTYFNKQYERFQEMVEQLSEKPDLVHCGNSAAALRFHKTWCNAIRYGITMYGLSPSPEIKEEIPFAIDEAFSLHTKIVHVKQIEKDDHVSYGATYTAQEKEWIATLPVGYADGWIRKLQGQEVLINGQRVPIVGRVCMDQCMIKLPSYYPVGTEVTLIGKNGNQMISIDEIARKLDTINYEVTCMINWRIPRIYKRHGQVCSTRNEILKM